MQNKKIYVISVLSIVLIFSSFLCVSLFSQETQPASELMTRLKTLPGVLDVNVMRGGRGGAGRESYDITFEQPLDHQNPKGPKFKQHVFISHTDYDKPVLLGTEGYAARGVGGGELQQMLGGNQVTVEHRFFGRSVPNPIQWEYLTVKQSADDLHAVVTSLKKLYKGKWVSTGASKGGQTALFFKCYYPDDVDATVAYVAPVNVSQEDPRINRFIETVGDEATRKRIKEYQIAMFKREDEILPLIKANAGTRTTFNELKGGISEGYEYGILEYPYAFWQYGTDPNSIPAPDASAETMAAHYTKVGMMRFYSDQGRKPFEPFMYQAFTEIGYYNYDITDFKPYMKTLKNPTNLAICPPGVKIVFNPATMYFVFNFLQYKADRVIYIYGGLDAWASTQMQLIGRTDAIKIVVPESHHGTGVRSFTPEQRELFYSTMERWLGFKLNRLGETPTRSQVTSESAVRPAAPTISGMDAAKWPEAKAFMGTIATAIRVYLAEKGPSAAVPTTLSQLGFVPNDLKGTYFQDSDFSFVISSMNPLTFTITCKPTSENRPANPPSMTLNQAGVWTP
jgi:hypothetical protein